MQTQTIGEFLLRRLEEAGVRHIFGVAGDYDLEFLQQLEDRGRPAWVGNCNELNASYAADGYARMNGIAALVVTNGVGAMSAMNGIAGAFCEHVPVVCICGSIPRKAIERRLGLHHTLQEGSYRDFYRAYAQVTAAQAQLTPANAAFEIDRVIRTAWTTKCPVYIELPSDIAYLQIQVPETPLELGSPTSDRERLEACTKAILGRLAKAKAPAVLLDGDADRFQARDAIKRFAEKAQIPVATLMASKAMFSEQSPLFAGLYAGAGSASNTRKTIEESDCLLAVGYAGSTRTAASSAIAYRRTRSGSAPFPPTSAKTTTRPSRSRTCSNGSQPPRRRAPHLDLPSRRPSPRTGAPPRRPMSRTS
jgi:indolepyruvate decarboxylase